MSGLARPAVSRSPASTASPALGVADALKIVEEIHDAGGELAAVDLGIDPTTPFGEFAITLMLGLGRMQRRQIADSWKEAQRRAVDRGVHVASRAPTGYVRNGDGLLEPHPDSAPHVTEVFRMKAAGASWRELAEYLRSHASRVRTARLNGRRGRSCT